MFLLLLLTHSDRDCTNIVSSRRQDGDINKAMSTLIRFHLASLSVTSNLRPHYRFHTLFTNTTRIPFSFGSIFTLMQFCRKRSAAQCRQKTFSHRKGRYSPPPPPPKKGVHSCTWKNKCSVQQSLVPPTHNPSHLIQAKLNIYIASSTAVKSSSLMEVGTPSLASH